MRSTSNRGGRLSPFAMSDLKYIANTQLEHLHARYTGTVNADTTRHEWAVHQHRDTAATIVGQPALQSYLALADGRTKARQRFEAAERMLQPCGPPPEERLD